MRRIRYAAFLHPVAGDEIVFDQNVAGRIGAFGTFSEIDSASQEIGLVGTEKAFGTNRMALRATGSIQIAHAVFTDDVVATNQKDAAVLHAFELVIFYQNAFAAHVRICVVKDDSEMSLRISGSRFLVDAAVRADLAIMKAVEVDALAVDLLHDVFGIEALVDVSGGVDGDRDAAVRGVYKIDREADIGEKVLDDSDVGCVSDLNGVASASVNLALVDEAIAIARTLVPGMRPDAVASDGAHLGEADLKIGSAFFEQDATGGVVLAALIARAGVFDLNEMNADLLGVRDEDREVDYVSDLEMAQDGTFTIVEQDSVQGIEFGEALVVGCDGETALQS